MCNAAKDHIGHLHSLHDENQNFCLLIDVSIPDDENVSLKETEKISNYKALELEISGMWNMRTKTLGTVEKGLELSYNQ